MLKACCERGKFHRILISVLTIYVNFLHIKVSFKIKFEKKHSSTWPLNNKYSQKIKPVTPSYRDKWVAVFFQLNFILESYFTSFLSPYPYLLGVSGLLKLSQHFTMRNVLNNGEWWDQLF